MKKYLLILGLACGSVVFGQTQIENGGFEGAWEDVSGTEDEPTQWSSLKSADALAALAPIVMFKSTDAHSGAFSVRLKNVTSFGVVANGIMTNGRIHADLDPELGNVFSDVTNPIWNLEMSDRPDSLVGWFKYAPSGSDRGKFEVLLHDNSAPGIVPEPGSTDHWVGKARYDVNAAPTWTRFSVPFNYYNDNSPNYALIVVTSGDSTIAVDGSEMWIDDLAFVYNPNTVVVEPAASQTIDVEVDGDELTVTETSNAGVVDPITREWKYSETPGTGYVSFVAPETGMTYTPNFDSPSIYYVVCETDFGTEVVLSNEIEVIVIDPAVNTVIVSPSADQSILTDEDGDELTVSESPAAADSREWKYSLTSGTGYVSFGAPETGMTYTPNFATVDTYYVVCESNFGGEAVISNEVVVIVTGSAGIQTEALEFSVITKGNELIVTHSTYAGAIFNVYDTDGRLVYSAPLIDATSTHTLTESGLFIYRVIQGNQLITGKVMLN
jgi:hypothetical protein